MMKSEHRPQPMGPGDLTHLLKASFDVTPIPPPRVGWPDTWLSRNQKHHLPAPDSTDLLKGGFLGTAKGLNW